MSVINSIIEFFTSFWSRLSDYVYNLNQGTTYIISFPGILKQFATILPSQFMLVVCATFTLITAVVVLRAFLAKV